MSTLLKTPSPLSIDQVFPLLIFNPTITYPTQLAFSRFQLNLSAQSAYHIDLFFFSLKKWRMLVENKVHCHHVQHASFFEGDAHRTVSLLLIFLQMSPISLPVCTRFLGLAMSTKCYRFNSHTPFLFFISNKQYIHIKHFRMIQSITRTT